MIWGLIFDHEGMHPFIVAIPFLAGTYLYHTLGNKDKITLLYVTSGLSRKEFLNTVLRTALRKYFIVILPILPFMVIYTFLYNLFEGTLSYYIPVIIFTLILSGWLFLTWIIWMATLQFADFDKLVSRSSETFKSRMRFGK